MTKNRCKLKAIKLFLGEDIKEKETQRGPHREAFQ